MGALNNRIETFTYPLEAYYASADNRNIELEKMVNALRITVMNCVSADYGNVAYEETNAYVNQHLNALFLFRMSALKWLVAHPSAVHDIDFENRFDDLKNHRDHFVLYHNVLFALRTNARVLQSLINDNENTRDVEITLSDLRQLPQLSYTDFLNYAALSMPDTQFSLFVDYLNASIRLEFGVLATFFIHQEKWDIPEFKVHELALFIANSTQEFGAIARELKPTKKQNSLVHLSLVEDPLMESDFFEEQNQLMEQGLDTYLETA